MPYRDGAALSEVYAAAREGGYGFFASNVAQFDVLVGLLQGADRVDSDAVLQFGRDSAVFFGGGDPVVGLDAFGVYLTRFAEFTDVGVFCNVEQVRNGDREMLVEAKLGRVERYRRFGEAFEQAREEMGPAWTTLMALSGKDSNA